MSIVQIHAALSKLCCVSMPMLHVHVHYACPCSCCISMSMLHVYVNVHIHIYRNAGMPDRPASSQSGTGVHYSHHLLWSYHSMGQAETPGREPCLLCSPLRSSSRGCPSAAAFTVSIGDIGLGRGGDIIHECLCLRLHHRWTSATPCRSGYGEYIDSWSLKDRDWSLRPTCLALDLQTFLFSPP